MVRWVKSTQCKNEKMKEAIRVQMKCAPFSNRDEIAAELFAILQSHTSTKIYSVNTNLHDFLLVIQNE